MITKSEFRKRREDLFAQLAPNSLAVISAGRLVTRSRDTEFPFRQNSDFFYLTGFHEPDALLLLSNSDKFAGNFSILFCLNKDPLAEIWQGRRTGPSKAAKQVNVDIAHPLEELEDLLEDYMDGHQQVYFAQGADTDVDELIFSTIDALRRAPKESKIAPRSINDINPFLHEMRMFKSPAEISVMRQAAKISAQAHCRAMRFCADGRYEYQLAAELHHEFAMHGAHSPAYGTIVGGGDNGCILHYTENNSSLSNGDLVLIDAGAELMGYAADITRTFPVSGKFTPPQAKLYQLVLDAQLAALELLKPGNTLKQATDVSIEVITQGLISLGLLEGDLQTNIKQQSYRAFYMHSLGHWLGLDVHDVGDYKVNGEERILSPGIVMTIEPGIYVAKDADVDPQWQGIGIRIEDNIVITEDGYEMLTDGVPKSIAEIEALMAG